MGSYTVFEVNNAYHWEYKYYVPYFFLFIFEDVDFKKVVTTEDGEDWFEFLGYESTAGKCLKKLDEYGYTKEFFLEVVDEIMLPEYESLANYHLEERALNFLPENPNEETHQKKTDQLKRQFEGVKKVGSFEVPKHNDHLAIFTEYLKYLIKHKPHSELYELCRGKIKKPRSFRTTKEQEEDFLKFKIAQIFGKTDTYNFGKEFKDINLESLVDFIHDHPEVFGRKLHFASSIFLQDYGDYGEIVDLIQVSMILSAVHHNTGVAIDVSDIMDGTLEEAEDEARKLKQDITNQIFKKTKIHNKFYEILSRRGSKKNSYFGKKLLNERFYLLENNENANQKGRDFEDFLDQLFSMSNELAVISKRLNLSDQEIDIVLQNNIAKPYIQSFQSPHIMIEAKYTKKKIGASQVRDFRAKIEDQSAVCKLGILFSISGFTKEAAQALKRSTKETIILADGSDIETYLHSTALPEEWLESLLKNKSFK